MKEFKQARHDVDLCVVGGGTAGLCAAIAAPDTELRSC